jgi:hypothetical protein
MLELRQKLSLCLQPSDWSSHHSTASLGEDRLLGLTRIKFGQVLCITNGSSNHNATEVTRGFIEPSFIHSVAIA